MSSSLIIFALALVTSLVGTPLIRDYLNKSGLFYNPFKQKKLKTMTAPRVGGIIIFIAFWVPFLISWHFNILSINFFNRFSTHFLGLLSGSFLILFVGLIDDLREIRSVWKYLILISAGIIAFYSGFKLQTIETPFGLVNLSIASLPLTLLWIFVITSAFHIIDSLDGLVCGMSLVGSITIFVLAILSDSWISCFFMSALAGASLGFLVFNFHPATIHVGSSGSLVLGYLLACVTILGSRRQAAVGLAIPMIIFALPIADSILTVLQQWIKRTSATRSNQEHIHHRLLAWGLSQKQTASILFCLTVFLSIIGIILTLCNSLVQFVIVIFLSIALFFALKITKRADFRLVSRISQQDMDQTKYKSEQWTLVNQVCNEIQFTGSEYQLIQLLTRIFKGLDLDHLILVTSIPSIRTLGKSFSYRWDREKTARFRNCHNVWSAQLAITKNDQKIGSIYVTHDADRKDLAADISSYLKLISDALAVRLHPGKALFPSQVMNPKGMKHRRESMNPKFLFINSEESGIHSLKSKMENKGWSVEINGDVEDGLSRIQKNSYDIVFVGLELPMTDKRNIIDTYLLEAPDLCIVAMGESRDLKQLNEIYDMGAVSFLPEPIEFETLNALVKTII